MYQIQVNRRTISHGIAQFEVLAKSEEEAIEQFALGYKNEVDNHIVSSFNDDTEPEIMRSAARR